MLRIITIIYIFFAFNPRLASFIDHILTEFLHLDIPDRVSTKLFIIPMILILIPLWVYNRYFKNSYQYENDKIIYSKKNTKSIPQKVIKFKESRVETFLSKVKSLIISIYKRIINYSYYQANREERRVFLLIGGLSVSSVLSLISIDKSMSSNIIVGTAYYSLLLLTYLILKQQLAKDKKLQTLIESVVLITVIINLVFSIFQVYFSTGFFINSITDNYGGFMQYSFFRFPNSIRPSGLFIDPNFGASFITAIVIIFTARLHREVQSSTSSSYLTKRNLLYILTISISLPYLQMVSSRTATIILFLYITLSLFILFANRIKYKRGRVFGSFLIINRLYDMLTLRDSSSREHLSYIINGLKIFLNNPLGVGIGNYSLVSNSEDSGRTNPHSSIVRSLAEQGVVGFLSYTYFFYDIIAEKIESKHYYRGVAIVSLLIGSFGYDYMMTPWFWIIVAMV